MRGVGRLAEVLWLAAAVGCVAATAVALGAQGGAPAAGGPRRPGAPGAAGAPGTPPAQERNLRILPKDISRQELGDIMQGFARSLGVGCDHCHMGESMETMDWANDDKDAKKNAREMMRLVRTINEGLAGLTKTDHTRAEVGCETCHRGLAVPPRPLGGDPRGEGARQRTGRGPRRIQRPARRGRGCRAVQTSRTSAEHRRAPAARREASAGRHRAAAEERFTLPPVGGCRGDARQHAGRERRRRGRPGRAPAGSRDRPENRAARGALGRLTGAAKPAP